jgi:hypothetical protein
LAEGERYGNHATGQPSWFPESHAAISLAFGCRQWSKLET